MITCSGWNSATVSPASSILPTTSSARYSSRCARETSFARVRLGAETIEWPNGADWAPESLHALLRARDPLRASTDDTSSAAIPVHTRDVPEISRFFGIVISMFYSDHARPHFRARCGGDSIVVEIDGDGIRGSFPPNRLPLLFEWRDLHRAELRANWERLRRGEQPLAIKPLE